MHPKHKNTVSSNKLKQLKKLMLGRLLWSPAWKRSGPILKWKVKKGSRSWQCTFLWPPMTHLTHQWTDPRPTRTMTHDFRVTIIANRLHTCYTHTEYNIHSILIWYFSYNKIRLSLVAGSRPHE